jgi:predicted PurR-regulated permease PerM
MEIVDKRTASILSTILLFIAAGAFVYFAARVLIVFVLAILFAYLLEPLVSRFQHWTPISRGSRSLAIAEVYLVLCVAIASVSFVIGSRIVDEARDLAKTLPDWIDRFTSGQIAVQIGSKHGWSYSTQAWVQSFLNAHSGTMLNWLTSAGRWAAQAAQNMVWILLIPILAIFLLKDGRAFSEDILEMVNRRQQKQFLAGITDDINEMLAQYIRSQLILAGLSVAAYMVVLSILRVPFALALGSVAGVMEFVPVVGPAVGGAAILGVSFLAGYHHILIVLGVLVVWRLVQDYVTTPRLMGSTLELHPMTIIFAVLVGAELGGVIGVYLSIPIAAALRIVWKRWQRVYAKPSIKVA